MTPVLIVSVVATAIIPALCFSGWIVHRQHRLITQMTHILASRTMGEYAAAQKKLSAVPSQGSDESYANAW
jgi:hypothetical protein